MEQKIVEGSEVEFVMIDDVLRFHNQVFVPSDDELRRKILTKAYSSLYTTHPKSVKIYQNLGRSFWWFGMKMDVTDFIAKCLVCQ